MASRFERRHPGESHQVERSIPVKVLYHADGTREIVGPDAVICNACPCCAIWTAVLQEFRDAAVAHVDQFHGLPVDLDAASCPICWLILGGEPGLPVDACAGCKCCVLWADQIQDARLSAPLHNAGKHSRANRFPDTCPVCWIAGGGIDGGEDNAI